MAWVELLESHAGSLDSLAKGAVTRRFRVWGGVSVAAILQDPGSISNDDGQFLPVIGSVHPDYIDQSMVLDHYSCETQSVTVIATATYTNSSGGSIKPNPDKRIGTSYERRNTELWYGMKTAFDKKADVPFTPITRWSMKPATVIENFMRLTYRTIVPKKDPFDPNKPCWDGKAMEQIRKAIGEIHRFAFDGAPAALWQFSGADPADRNLEEAVTVTYSWVMDPGTALFQIEHPDKDPLDSFFWPPQDKPDGFGKKFVRVPFTKLVWAIDIKPGKDKDGNDIPPTYDPLFFSLKTSVVNADGWKALPGLLP